MMHGPEKSDPSIRAKKPANNPGQPGTESVEQREGTEGSTGHAAHAPDPEPGKRVPEAGACTRSCL
jgi:hypothetical protein